jgi:hypothetical protein
MTKIEALQSLAAAHIEAAVQLSNKSPSMAITHIQEARKLYALIAQATDEDVNDETTPTVQ